MLQASQNKGIWVEIIFHNKMRKSNTWIRKQNNLLFKLTGLLCGPPPYRRGRILRRTLSVRPSRYRMKFFYFTVEPSYERTSKIEKFRFSLMGQRHVCTFRHAHRAAYRTAISAAQILVVFSSASQSTPAQDWFFPYIIKLSLLRSTSSWSITRKLIQLSAFCASDNDDSFHKCRLDFQTVVINTVYRLRMVIFLLVGLGQL